jgi:hypothetical protein
MLGIAAHPRCVSKENPMSTFPMPNLVSPLQLADRLIQLASDADRAGFAGAAATLLGLAYSVLDRDALAAA